MNLYAGKMLIVDLTHARVSVEALRREWLRDYWGGGGLALRYYWQVVTPRVDPLSPDNAIVLMTGPLCGTLVPLASGLCLVSKSPHTGTVFESSVGGGFGPELKFAGYDGIVITGRADSPVFLRIVDDQVSIESAADLAGKGVFETEQLLQKAAGTSDARTLAIGPAAERLVTYSIIGADTYRQFGRGGTGALFGSKNLKGIVCRGTGAVRVARMKEFLAQIDLHKRGNLLNDTRLWAYARGPMIAGDAAREPDNSAFGVLGSDAIQAAKLGDRACVSCPVACGKFTRINSVEVERAEYEDLGLCSADSDVTELETAIRFNRLCDDLGLDAASCARVVNLATQLTESGQHDFGLHSSDADTCLDVIYEIATLSTPRGRDLALGAGKLGEKFVVVPPVVPQASDMAPADAIDDDCDNALQRVVKEQNFSCIRWSMGICDHWGMVNAGVVADLLGAGLGETVTPEELERSGERIWNLGTLFNLRAECTDVSARLVGKAIGSGCAGDAAAGTGALQGYYRLRGWDDGGVPSSGKLAELGLGRL